MSISHLMYDTVFLLLLYKPYSIVIEVLFKLKFDVWTLFNMVVLDIYCSERMEWERNYVWFLL